MKNIRIFILFFVIVSYALPMVGFAAELTQDRNVRLNLSTPPYVDEIRIASGSSLAGAQSFPYTGNTITWDLCQGASSCASGTYTITIAFVQQGQILAQRTRSISYNPTIPSAPQQPDKPKDPPVDIPQLPVIPTFEPEDLPPVPETIPVEIPVQPLIPVNPPPVEVVPPIVISPVVQKAGESLAVIGSGVSLAVGVASAVPSAASATEIFILLPLRLWNILLIFLGIRKKARPWGVVYDSKSKQPLDPVYVSLIDTAGNEIASSITDITGRYGFLVPAGTYRIVAGKTKYTFPSKKLSGMSEDALYQNLYFGEEITLGADAVLRKNIPMDTETSDWNQAEKERMGVGRVRGVSLWLARIADFLLYLGACIAIVFLFRDPRTLNFVFVGVYAFLFLLRAFGLRPKSYGVVRIADKPLANAIMRIMSAELKREVAHAITDDKGHYYCLVPKGTYTVNIEEKQADEVYTPRFTSGVVRAKSGIINTSFSIEK